MAEKLHLADTEKAEFTRYERSCKKRRKFCQKEMSLRVFHSNKWIRKLVLPMSWKRRHSNSKMYAEQMVVFEQKCDDAKLYNCSVWLDSTGDERHEQRYDLKGLTIFYHVI